MNGAGAPVGLGPAWRINPLVELRLKVWGGSCVAFEAVSGETTVVDPLYAAALVHFGADARSPSEVLESLAQELGVPVSQQLHEELNDALAEFVSRGWLEAATLAA